MYLIYLDFNPHLLSKYHSHTATLHLNDWVNAYFYVYLLIFRAIFDLSNKIALLILLGMFALKAKKKKQKIEN